MKNHYKPLFRIALAFVLFISASSAFAQLKVGSNPTVINKASILELESDKQGLLLPRLSDTTAINALTPPDGMLIYLASPVATGRGLYIRKAGIWQRFMTDSSSLDKWSKAGDQLAGTEKFGSLNAQTIRMITNNIERLNIDGTSGNVNIAKSLKVADTTTSGKLVVNDSVQFKNINSTTGITEMLVIDTTTGAIRRTKLSPDAFKSWIVGPFSETTSANGLTRKVGPGVNGVDTLVLHAASATTAGGVSATAQTFGGHKTFQDSLTAAKTLLVGATGSANSTLQVQGSVSMSIRTITASTTITNTDYTLLVDASGGAVTVTLPAPSTSINGRTYVIKKIAGDLANDVIVNGPIENGTSFSLYNDWTVLKVQTDGNRWYVIK